MSDMPKMTRGSFDIHWNPDPSEEKRLRVTGYIFGPFGIDSDPQRCYAADERGWHITHLRTGFKIAGEFPRLIDAKLFATRVIKMGGSMWDRSFLKWGVIPNKRSKFVSVAIQIYDAAMEGKDSFNERSQRMR